MTPEPGWYPDPAAPDQQRYWDGEQWLGSPLPVDAIPPPTPPPAMAVPAAPAPEAGWQPGPLPGGPAKPVRTPPPAPPPIPQGHVRVPGKTAAIPIDVARLAPLRQRIVARLIDIVAVLLLCAAVNGYFWYRLIQELEPYVSQGNAFSQEAFSPEATRLNWIIIVVTIGLWFAYEVPGTANSGQTLGKRLVGIRVVRLTDDKMLTFGQSIRRWLILMLPSPTLSAFCGLPLQLVDLLWCLWDKPARQCLHDKAVASIVVRADQPIINAPGSTE